MRGALVGAGGVAAAWWAAPAPAAFFPPLAAALRIPRRLPTARGVALTFDDGPHPEGTPAVLDKLDRCGAIATFFLVGEQAERFPSLAAEIAAAGHGVALHGYRHVFLLRRTPRAVADDFERALDAVARASGVTPRLYRPPYGVLSTAALRLVRRRGWTPFLWSRWGRDWQRQASAQSIASLAASRLEPGDVVLLHDADHYSAPDSWRKTAAALPLVCDAAAARGLPFVSLTHST